MGNKHGHGMGWSLHRFVGIGGGNRASLHVRYSSRLISRSCLLFPPLRACSRRTARAGHTATHESNGKRTVTGGGYHVGLG